MTTENRRELFKSKEHNHTTTIAPPDWRNQFTWCPVCQYWYLPLLHDTRPKVKDGRSKVLTNGA